MEPPAVVPKRKRMPISEAIKILTLRREFIIKSSVEGKAFASHWRGGKEQEALDYVIPLLKKIQDFRHRKMGDGIYTLSVDELIDEFLEIESEKDKEFGLNLTKEIKSP